MNYYLPYDIWYEIKQFLFKNKCDAKYCLANYPDYPECQYINNCDVRFCKILDKFNKPKIQYYCKYCCFKDVKIEFMFYVNSEYENKIREKDKNKKRKTDFKSKPYNDFKWMNTQMLMNELFYGSINAEYPDSENSEKLFYPEYKHYLNKLIEFQKVNIKNHT